MPSFVPTNTGMIVWAARMKTAVIAPSAISMIQKIVEASRKASLLSPLLEELGEHRHERGRERRIREQVADEVRYLERQGERRVGPCSVPKKLAARISRGEPGDPREAGRYREDRRVAGHAAVRALAAAFGDWGRGAQGRYSTAPRGLDRLRPCAMANIASQKKRILRAERERLENRRHTSAIKTYFRRLETAVGEGDGERVATEHRMLVSLIDKAVKTLRAASQHGRPQEVPRRADRPRGLT